MQFEHGGNISAYSEQLGIDESELLDFSVNINPLGFPEYLRDIICDNFGKIYNYPEIYAESLKRIIAENYDVSPENIIVGNGSSQLIYLIPRALKLKKPVIVNPTFSEYGNALNVFKITPVSYQLSEEDNFRLNTETLFKFLEKQDYCSLFFCNPSNPSGVVLSDVEVLSIAEYLDKRGKLFVIDEAFMDFTDQTGLIKRNFKNVIVLKSLTKIFGIAGIRLGFLKGAKSIIEKIKNYMEPWSVNIFSIIAGKRLIKDKNFILKTKKFVEKERHFIVKELSCLPNLKIFESSTNYLLMKILNDNNVEQLQNFFIDKKIFIRNCSNFTGLNNKFFRIGIRKREENQILIDGLKEFIR